MEQVDQKDYGSSMLGDIKKLMSSKLPMVWWWSKYVGNQAASMVYSNLN